MQGLSLIGIVLVLAVLGGFVAFLGDMLGRKVGKKRLRFRNLRPRHTAVAFTVITGALIPIGTTAVIMSVNAQVRHWIMEGPQLVERRNELVAELRIKSSEKSAVDQALKTAQANREEVDRQLAQVTKQYEESQNRLSVLDKQIQALTTQEERLKARLVKTETDLKEKTLQANNLEQKNKTLRTDNESLLKESLRVQHEIIAAEHKLKEAETRAADAELKAAEAEHKASQLATEIKRLNGEYSELMHKVSTAQFELGNLMSSIGLLRGSPVLFERGEELARYVCQGGVSTEEARNKLNLVVRQASEKAAAHGAKPDEFGRFASIQDRQRILPEGTIVNISAADQMAAYSEAISRFDSEIVIVARAFLNFFFADAEHGRIVPLELDIYPNNLIYTKGDVVAITQIDGSRSEDEILTDILAFVSGDLRRRALMRGLIPATVRGPLAELTVRQASTLVTEIKRAGQPVHVEARAATNIKSADALVLDFIVRKQQ